MVKIFLGLLLVGLSLFAQEEDLLEQKIISLVGEYTYEKNHDFIQIIFSPESEYYVNDRLDNVKIVETLKENGLLNLFFDKPQEFELTFTSNGNPLYFVKLISDALRSMGYYRFITKSAKTDSSGFHWSISFQTEYATDPILLRQALLKQQCDISDIERITPQKWHYTINMMQAHLNLKVVKPQERLSLKNTHSSIWLDVSRIKHITITSNRSSHWHPHVAFFDKTMHLLKVYTREKRTWKITFKLPKDCMYIKIGDLYTSKNLRAGLDILGRDEK